MEANQIESDLQGNFPVSPEEMTCGIRYTLRGLRRGRAQAESELVKEAAKNPKAKPPSEEYEFDPDV